jgi:hypothetical protein
VGGVETLYLGPSPSQENRPAHVAARESEKE